MSVKLFRPDNQITDASGKFFAVGDFNSNEWISEEDFVAGLPLGIQTATTQTEFDELTAAGEQFINISSSFSGNLDISSATSFTTIYSLSSLGLSIRCATDSNAVRIIANSVQLSDSSGAVVNLLGSQIGILTVNQEVVIDQSYIGKISSSPVNTNITLRDCTVGYFIVNGAISGYMARATVQLTQGVATSSYTGTIIDSCLGFCHSSGSLQFNGTEVKDTLTSYFGSGRKSVNLS